MLCRLFLCFALTTFAIATEHDLPVLRSKPASQFSLQTFGGATVSLSDYRGKVVIVNFWATWCEYCRQEMLWLAELPEKYASQGLEVLGILTNSAGKNKVAKLTQDFGVRYPILLCNHNTAQEYGGLPNLPVSFYVGHDGRVVEEVADSMSKAEMETIIKKLLSPRS